MIQVIGTKKCKETAKAIRFFKEHRIENQFRDLKVKELSDGELSKIIQKVSPNELIDSSSSSYQKRGMSYIDFDPIEEIKEDNSLLKTPIVRNGAEVTVGYQPDIWKKWGNQ